MVGRIIFGFIAGALATLIVHQPVIFGFIKAGLITAAPNAPPPMVYNMNAFNGAPAVIANLFKGFGLPGFPVILNLTFWGGIWGIAYGLLFTRVPGPTLLKGLAMAAVMLVLVNWMLLPTLRGQPTFAGWVPQRMAVGAAVNTAFCLGTAFLFSMFRRSD